MQRSFCMEQFFFAPLPSLLHGGTQHERPQFPTVSAKSASNRAGNWPSPQHSPLSFRPGHLRFGRMEPISDEETAPGVQRVSFFVLKAGTLVAPGTLAKLGPALTASSPGRTSPAATGKERAPIPASASSLPPPFRCVSHVSPHSRLVLASPAEAQPIGRSYWKQQTTNTAERSNNSGRLLTSGEGTKSRGQAIQR